MHLRSAFLCLTLFLLLAPVAAPAEPFDQASEARIAADGRPGEMQPPEPLFAVQTSPYTLRVEFDAALDRDGSATNPASWGVTGPWVVAVASRRGPSTVDLLVWPAPDGVPVASTSAPDLRLSLHNLAYGLAGPEDAELLRYILENGFPPYDEGVGEVRILAPLRGENGAVLEPPSTVPGVLEPAMPDCTADAFPDGTLTDPVVAQVCESGGIGAIAFPVDASESVPEIGGTIQTWDWTQTFPPCFNPLDTDPPGAPDCIFESIVPIPNPVEDTTNPTAFDIIFDTGGALVYLLSVDIEDDTTCTDSALLTLTVLPFPEIVDVPPGVDDRNGDANGVLCAGETLTFFTNVIDNSAIPTDSLIWSYDFDLATDSDGDTVPDNDIDAQGTAPTGLLEVDWAYAVDAGYDFRLTIQDADSGLLPLSQGCGDIADGFVSLSPSPTATAAFAGGAPPTCETAGGTEIFLDGAGTDPGGGALAFRWTTTAGTFRNSGTQDTLLEDPVLDLGPGELFADLTLEVTGSNGCTAFDMLMVALNPAPVADAKQGDPANLYEACETGGDVLVPLDGFGTDPDGALPAYLWQTSAGAFQDTGTADSTLEDPVLVLPQGVLSASLDLSVTSSVGLCTTSDSASVNILAAAFADAGGPYQACASEDGSASVSLDASNTVPFDPVNQTFFWEIVSGPGIIVAPGTFAPRLDLAPGTGAATVRVRLTVTQPNGCPSTSETDVEVFAAPVNDAGGPYEGCEGESIPLDGTVSASSGGTIQVLWTTGITGATFAPSATIEDPDLDLPVGAPSGSVTLVVQEQVPGGPVCASSSTAQVTVGRVPTVDAGGPYMACSGEPVQLNGAAAATGGGTLTVEWTGDPAGLTFTPSANILDPTVQAPGGYAGNVILTATETMPGGPACRAAATAQLTFWDQPAADITGFDPACPGATVQGSVEITGGTAPFDIQWKLGDGATASGPDVSHVYDSPKLYLVTVTVTDANGCGAFDSYTLEIWSPPTLSVQSTSPVCQGEEMGFRARVRSPYQPVDLLWDFGDGEQAGGVTQVLHLYATSGLFDVTLSGTDANGCTARVVHQAQVLALPVGEIVTDGPACPNDLLSFGVTPDTFDPVLWDFGDGRTGSGNPTTHAYGEPGDYTVGARFTDSNGCVGETTAGMDILDVSLQLAASGIDDSGMGDGDGFPEPGEIVDVRTIVSNLGADTAPSVEVSIVSIDGPAQVYRQTAPVGDLPGSMNAEARPAVQIDSTAPCGSLITVTLQATSGGDNCTTPGYGSFRIGVPVANTEGGFLRATNDGVLSRLPALVRGDGIWELAWADQMLRHDNLGEEVFAKRLTDEGHMYGFPMAVPQAAGESSDPAITWLPGMREFGLVWTDTMGGGNDVWFRNADFRGVPYGPLANLTPTTGASQRPVLLPYGDGFVLVWEDYRTGDARVMMKRLGVSGNPIGGEYDLSGGGQNTWPAAAMAPGGRVGVAWVRNGGLVFQTFDVRSGEPLSALQVAASSGASSPAMAWSGDHYALSWTDVRSGTPTLWHAGYDLAGLVLKQPSAVGGAGQVTSGPALGTDGDGTVLIAWAARDDLYTALLGRQGLTGDPILLSDPETVSGDPAIAWAADLGYFLVAWRGEGFNEEAIFTQRVWQDAVLRCDPVPPAPSLPQLAPVSGLRLGKAPSGEVLATWDDGGRGDGYRIYRGRLDTLRFMGYMHEARVCSTENRAWTGDGGQPGSWTYLVSHLDTGGREGPLGAADLDGDGLGDLPRPAGPATCPVHAPPFR